MKSRVMIIDDDKEFLEEIREVLILNDYEAITLDDPAFALEKVVASKPDLILMDMMMPNESGFQVAWKLGFFSALKRIPIIAISGYLNERQRALVRDYGIRDCVSKPFDPIELISKIEGAL